ncbi:MAG: hypothetical protein V4544_06785 [Pseudomonadota bacterium]
MKKINYFDKNSFFYAAISVLLFLPTVVESSFSIPTLNELGSKIWVESRIKEYPELEWLLADDVHYTQEGKADQVEQAVLHKRKSGHSFAMF